MEENNRRCKPGSGGGERSQLVVIYLVREGNVAVTEQQDENWRVEQRGRPKL